MSESHIFFLAFTLGGIFMLSIGYAIHRYTVKQIETAALKAMDAMTHHAEKALEDLMSRISDNPPK